MTGMLPARGAHVWAAPFPALRPDVPSPLFVLGTASLLGVNADTAVPDAALAVLDALFDREVRRVFAAHEPGDWNIPLADPDALALTRLAPDFFSIPAIGLTRAVAAGTHGFASWSFLSPAAEDVVVGQTRDVVEGRLTARDHLDALQAAADGERAPALD